MPMFYGTQTDYISKLNVLASDYTTTSIGATVGGTTTLDCSLGSVFHVTLGAGNTTIAFSNIPNATFEIIVIIKKDNSGTSRVVTWPTGTRWNDGADNSTGPSLSPMTANLVHIFKLFTINSGTRFYAQYVAGNFVA
jgi:hypothetical protein